MRLRGKVVPLNGLHLTGSMANSRSRNRRQACAAFPLQTTDKICLETHGSDSKIEAQHAFVD